MRSLRLCMDGVGNAKLESLPLPFLFFGPTATDADSARMPAPESMLACERVRTRRMKSGAAHDADGRHLLVVVSGALEVATPDMRATVGPGDVLLVDDAGASGRTITAVGDCRLVQLEVADSWQPSGVVPPMLDEGARDGQAAPKVEHMYVEDDQARFRGRVDLFDDDRPRETSRTMVMCLSPASFGDWHTEEATSLVVVLTGGFELEVGGGGGAVEVFRAGDVCLVQDRRGQGHITRTHGETRFIAVSVPEEEVW